LIPAGLPFAPLAFAWFEDPHAAIANVPTVAVRATSSRCVTATVVQTGG
jgi:hypothetical protein